MPYNYRLQRAYLELGTEGGNRRESEWKCPKCSSKASVIESSAVVMLRKGFLMTEEGVVRGETMGWILAS